LTSTQISPVMGDRLDATEARRKERKKEWNARYRNKKAAEVELLRKEVASLLATLRAVSGLLTAHPNPYKAALLRRAASYLERQDERRWASLGLMIPFANPYRSHYSGHLARHEKVNLING
jgi:hypothetical protein